MKKMIADLHVHPGLKGFASQGYPESEGRTIWDAYPMQERSLRSLNFLIRRAIRELSKESQAHLDACSEAHLRLPFFVLYPVERPMFALERQKPFRRFWKMVLPKSKYIDLGAAVSGFPRERIRQILENNVENDIDDGVNYYEQYLLEKNYLFEQTTCHSEKHPDDCFKLANSYEELKRLLKKEKTIAGVLTVEGAHSFGHYKHHSTFAKTYEELNKEEEQLLRQSLLQNIREEKNSRTPAFFVTFSHHFNNLLAGHARSLSGKSSFFPFLPWPNRPGMRHIFNQEPNLNNDFSALGREALDLFLDKEQGRRMLIDTKHMSIAARQTFYRIVQQRREEGDHIPIISSHTAVSGWPTLEEAARHPETKNIDKDAFFSRWQINLTDEDILAIYDSDGIMGLVLHEGRMPGGLFEKEARKYKKLIRKLARKEDQQSCRHLEDCLWQLREHYLQLLWSNVFHILKVIRDKRGANGWKTIALGSDYDGLVNPFNSYQKVSCFYNLKIEMLAYLLSGKPILYADRGHGKLLSKKEVQQLMFGQDPEEAVDALFYDHVDQFLAKYFTYEYLGGRKTAEAAKVAEM
jgi:microsomal dipeptidase-like Zn-dependent dipeptidase